MGKIIYLIIICFFQINLINAQNTEAEKQIVKNLVLKSYVEGILESETKSKLEGIHESFNLIIIKENGVIKYPLKKVVEDRADNFSHGNVECNFELIDISGNAAIVKLILTSGEKRYTDYISLYKFKEGWKIITVMDNPE